MTTHFAVSIGDTQETSSTLSTIEGTAVSGEDTLIDNGVTRHGWPAGQGIILRFRFLRPNKSDRGDEEEKGLKDSLHDGWWVREVGI